MTACGGAIAVAPLVPGACAGLRIAMEPDPDLSIRGRIGALIAAEAGALVRGEDGAAFPLDIETRARALLVAASPFELSALEAALAAAGCLSLGGRPLEPRRPACPEPHISV